MRLEFKDYQKKGIEFILTRPAAGMLLDPGLGKTAIALAAFKLLRSRGFATRCLVIAPMRVATNQWPDEIEKWEDFDELSYVVLHGPKKDELAKLKVDVYIVNYDGLGWLCSKAGREVIKRCDFLVIDESSYIKNSRTTRFQLIREHVITRIGRRVILTGSPMPNSLLDLWAQAYALDGGRTLGKFFSHYRAKYFVPTDSGWEIGDGCEDKIYKAAAPLMMRMDANDYLNMPPLNIVDRVITLPDKARKAYDDMESRFVADLYSGKVRASNAAVASGKLRQIVSGAVYAQVGSEAFDLVHEEKIAAVQELVEELSGKPLLVFVQFAHEVARLREVFGEHVPYLGAGISARDTSDVLKRWNEGKLPLLFGHPMSMGHGLNMQFGGAHMAYMSLPWSYEQYDQSMRRLWRQGQTKRVMVYRILARDTIDDAVVRALTRKARGQNAFFTALQTYYAARSKPSDGVSIDLASVNIRGQKTARKSSVNSPRSKSAKKSA